MLKENIVLYTAAQPREYKSLRYTVLENIPVITKLHVKGRKIYSVAILSTSHPDILHFNISFVCSVCFFFCNYMYLNVISPLLFFINLFFYYLCWINLAVICVWAISCDQTAWVSVHVHASLYTGGHGHLLEQAIVKSVLKRFCSHLRIILLFFVAGSINKICNIKNERALRAVSLQSRWLHSVIRSLK